ncbi:MAG: hypothetical protein AAFZ38_12605 [Myxococcota bacterium]
MRQTPIVFCLASIWGLGCGQTQEPTASGPSELRETEQETTASITAAPGLPEWPFGLRIAMRSRTTGQYVTANPNPDVALTAAASGAAVWELFDVEHHYGDIISLRAVSNGKYLMSTPPGVLRANSGNTSTWEQFHWRRNDNGTISLHARSNAKYVQVRPDLPDGRPQTIETLGSHSDGDWTQFDWEAFSRLEITADENSTKQISLPGVTEHPSLSALGVTFRVDQWTLDLEADVSRLEFTFRGYRTGSEVISGRFSYDLDVANGLGEVTLESLSDAQRDALFSGTEIFAPYRDELSNEQLYSAFLALNLSMERADLESSRASASASLALRSTGSVSKASSGSSDTLAADSSEAGCNEGPGLPAVSANGYLHRGRSRACGRAIGNTIAVLVGGSLVCGLTTAAVIPTGPGTVLTGAACAVGVTIAVVGFASEMRCECDAVETLGLGECTCDSELGYSNPSTDTINGLVKDGDGNLFCASCPEGTAWDPEAGRGGACICENDGGFPTGVSCSGPSHVATCACDATRGLVQLEDGSCGCRPASIFDERAGICRDTIRVTSTGSTELYVRDSGEFHSIRDYESSSACNGLRYACSYVYAPLLESWETAEGVYYRAHNCEGEPTVWHGVRYTYPDSSYWREDLNGSGSASAVSCREYLGLD